ncbi:MAG: hypothetical protein V4592_03775 [Bacteroidota bacterium]
MKKVNITGTLQNVAEGAIIITISGPDHHTMTYTFHQSFSLPLAVINGDYYISISVFTNGVFILDITGDCQNLIPKLPFTFTESRQTFYLKVA